MGTLKLCMQNVNDRNSQRFVQFEVMAEQEKSYLSYIDKDLYWLSRLKI